MSERIERSDQSKPKPLTSSYPSPQEWQEHYQRRRTETHGLQIETEERLYHSGLVEIFIDSANNLRQSYPDAHVHLRFPPEHSYGDPTLTLRLAWHITRTTDPGPSGIYFDTALCRISLDDQSADGLRVGFGKHSGPFDYDLTPYPEDSPKIKPTVVRSAEPDFIIKSKTALTKLIEHPEFEKDHSPYIFLTGMDKAFSLFWYIIDRAERDAVRSDRSRLKILYPSPKDIVISR